MDSHLRIDIRPDDLQRALGAGARSVPVDHAEASRKAEHEGDVFSNGHPLDEPKILVEECDRQVTQRRGSRPVRGNVTVPESSEWTPARILISVDLPAPFSPRSATISPAPTSMRASPRARVPPNRFDTPRIARRYCFNRWERATGK